MSFSPSTPTLGTLSPEARERMREGTRDLLHMLSFGRPHATKGEATFIRLFVDSLSLLGHTVEADMYGNRWIRIGADNPKIPNVLWSCHVDTMDKNDDRKGIGWASDGETLVLKKRKPGRCLGADDGAGVWMLTQMIRAGVPGTYVFHRGEECGRLGSKHVKDFESERLVGFDACIAFDRKGFDNLITHQMGERGASKDFAESLSGAIYDASSGSLCYEADPTGSYTDSYTYFDLISECTNLSVGYHHEHGPAETLNVKHLWRLRNAMVRLDLSKLKIMRDPTKVEYDDSAWGYSGKYTGGYGGGWTWDDDPNGPFASLNKDEAPLTLEALCFDEPETAAALLESLGIGVPEFLEELSATTGRHVPGSYRSIMEG